MLSAALWPSLSAPAVWLSLLLCAAVSAAALCAARWRASSSWRRFYGGPPDGAQRAAFASPARELSFQRALDAASARTVVLDTVLATCDPALVRPLLLSRAHSTTRSWLYRALAWVLPSSDGILFLAGDDWRTRHRADSLSYHVFYAGARAGYFKYFKE